MNFIVLIVFNLIFWGIELYFFQGLKLVLSPKYQNFYLAFMILLSLVINVILFNFPQAVHASAFNKYFISINLVFLICKLLACITLLVSDIGRLGVFMYDGIRGVLGLEISSYDPSRSKFIGQLSVAIAGIPFLGALYGMVKTAFDFKVYHQTLTFPNLPPSFNNFKIVQITDLHSGSFVSQEPILDIIEKINALQADLIVFTGDMVNTFSDEIEPYIETWKTHLKPPALGIFSILGNHDYPKYTQRTGTAEEHAYHEQNMIKNHQRLGWKLLKNEAVLLEKQGEKIGLLGVENWGKGNFPKEGDLKKAKAHLTEEVPFKLLLSHDPSYWREEILKHKDIDLTLSGHTHGSQIGIENHFIKWAPGQYIYEEWAGLYTENHQHIYVNRGLGFIGYMGRIGIQPEIALLTLQSTT